MFELIKELLESNRQNIEVHFLPEFRETYSEFKNTPGVQDSLQEFFRCKKQWPQEALMSSMKDHALQGNHYKQFKMMECHLDNNILLLYKFDKNILTLVLCCWHEDVKGPRAKSMVNKLKKILN
jgi:mRNA-degrading endonuclease YafQ of YafQ-DinJ toxin-antitoxin module